MPENYNIFYIDLPNKIYGFTLYDKADDFYSIYLNSRHSYYENQKAFEHEMNHIILGDLKRPVDINKIEYVR